MLSIIISVYNGQNFLLQTLQSIVNQDFQNFECLMIDDGSTDNTKSIVNEFIKNLDNFKYFKR